MTTRAQLGRPVLVALDGSPLAETALPWAVRLAMKWRAPLLLARVVDADDEDGAAYLRGKVDALRAAHAELVVHTEVARGDPTVVLLEIEQLSDARIAVLTTHGRTGLVRWARGSVAESIARYGTAPALLVRPWDQPEAVAGRRADGRSGLRVVVPLDGSTLAEGVLPLAQELAVGDGGELILTAMVQSHPEQSIGPYYQPKTEESRREARHYLDRLCEGIVRKGVSARSVVGVEHDVAGAIVDFATMESADLIALSTHGRGALGRLLYGSIADRVAHAATVPVVLYRPTVPIRARDVLTVERATPMLAGV